MSVVAVVTAAATVGGAYLTSRNNKDIADKGNAQSAENMALAKQVDFTTMSPEAKATLQGLFGPAAGVAGGVLGQDFGALRSSITQNALKESLTNTLNTEIPGLKNSMNKAGAYNSTAFGVSLNDSIASGQAKAFYQAQAAGNERVASELSLLGPILQLLNIDKGSGKVGVDAIGALNPVTQGKTDWNPAIGSTVQAIGSLFADNKGRAKSPYEDG